MSLTEIPTVRPGQSGATVEVLEDVVTKWSQDERIVARLEEQYHWLHNHPARGLVRVINVIHGGYTMERLSPLPVHVIDPSKLAREIIAVLSTDCWSRRAEVKASWGVHQTYVLSRLVELGLEGRFGNELLNQGDAVRQLTEAEQLRPCLTHGDPTFSNTLLRYGRLVLIDPLPAGETMPPLRAVDLGKVLQSLLGYERIRFGLPWPEPMRYDDARQLIASYCTSVGEWLAVRYFAAVHFVRLLPYAPVGYRPALTEVLSGLCSL